MIDWRAVADAIAPWWPTIAITGVSAIWGYLAGKYRALARGALDNAAVALDMLTQMELARDPGREVHERLARVMEAQMIRLDGPPVSPSERRAAAMGMTAALIENIRVAGLTLVAEGTNDDEA